MNRFAGINGFRVSTPETSITSAPFTQTLTDPDAPTNTSALVENNVQAAKLAAALNATEACATYGTASVAATNGSWIITYGDQADQVPLSRNEKITVKLLSPDAKEVKPTDEGTLKWTLELKPAEKRELTVKFTVEFANDVNVAGLE